MLLYVTGLRSRNSDFRKMESILENMNMYENC